MKASVLAVSDNKALLHESMGHQILSCNKYTPVDAIVSAIDNISTADVKNVSKIL